MKKFQQCSLLGWTILVGCSAPVRAVVSENTALRQQMLEDAPRFMGHPIYDRSIEYASDTVQHAWKTLMDLQAHVPLEDAASSAGDPEDWNRNVFRPWMEAYKSDLRKVLVSVQGFSNGISVDTLFASLVSVMAFDDLATRMKAFPMPPTLRGNAVAVSAWQEQRDAMVASVRVTQLSAWTQCAAVGDSLPEGLRMWAQECEKQVKEIEPLASQAGQSATTAGSSVSAACAQTDTYIAPEAPAPDATAREEIAVVYTDSRVAGHERDQLIRAVARRIHQWNRALHVLTTSEVYSAEQLVAARKLTQRGPVCGQAPPLGLVLAQTHSNLVFAQVNTVCEIETHTTEGSTPTTSTAQHCSLQVSFIRPGAPENTAELPATLRASVTNTTSAGWIAAAPLLVPDEGGTSGIFAVLGGMSDSSATMTVHNAADDDAFLRLPTVLGDARTEIIACRNTGPLAPFKVNLTISATGEGGDVVVAPDEGTTAELAAQAECVRTAVAKLHWPCTRTGAPVPVEVRVCVGQM